MLGGKDKMSVNQVFEKNDGNERVERIQEKAFKFLSKLYSLCKDEQSKEFDMYVVGKRLGYNATETECIVETLSRAELIKAVKFSCKVSIATYGIMVTKGEITARYAPLL
jgi:hypothetical protein